MFAILTKLSIRSLATSALLLVTLVIGFNVYDPGITLAQDAAPAQPTGLEVTSEDFHSVSIAWDDPQDSSITGYQILRRSRDGDTYGDGQGDAEFVSIEDDTGAPATEYTDSSVTPRTRYVYRIKAINSAGLSRRSSYANAETSGPPGRPTGLAVSSASHDSITVQWDDPLDDSITGYQILRRSRDGGTYADGEGSWEFVVIEDDTGTADIEYIDTTVTAETRYVYRVKARNPGGLSERSSYANAETTTAPPVAPQPTPIPEPTPGPTPEAKQQTAQSQEPTTRKDSQGGLRTDQQQGESAATLSSITVDGTALPGFSSGRTAHQFGVDSSAEQVTLTATAFPANAPISFGTEDADTNAEGHQVNLSFGANEVTITVGPALLGVQLLDATDYSITVNRGVADDFGWKAGADFDALLAAGNDHPIGIWANVTHLWVADGDDLKLYAYQLATRTRAADRDIALDSDNADPKGIWSNGETIWVVDSVDRDLYAYTLESGSRDSTKDFTDLGDDGDDYYGIWSDGETVWLSNGNVPTIDAYDFSSGEKKQELSYTELEPSGQDHVTGIWSDGVTMWVADPDGNLIHPYDAPQGLRSQGRSFQTLSNADNSSPGGIWSDGVTLWVSDTDNGKVYSYNLPASNNTDLRTITVDGSHVDSVIPGATEYLYRVAESTSQVTLAATSRHPEGTVYHGTLDADDTVDGHQVDLKVGSNNVAIVVTAEDGTTTAYHTLTINRASTQLFDWAVLHDLENVLGSGDEYPAGIWSDGTYIWASGGDDRKLYAYELSTGERHSDGDISLHTDNGDPKGIWSEGATMWVLDGADRKLYAYNLESGARDEAKDLGEFGDEDDEFYGIWSDGDTVWLSNGNIPTVDAFDFNSGEEKQELRYGGLEPSGQDYVAGIWSDGVTMWVVDPNRKSIFSYSSLESEFNPGWDFRRLNAAGNTSPSDIWSDGVTMWVADSDDGKIYSYNMRSSDNAELRSISVAGRKLTGFDPDTHSYSLNVSSNVGQASVRGIPRQSFATVSYSPDDAVTNPGGYQVDLEPGANTVTITVLAQDGVTTEEYTVTINRGSAEPFGWKVIDDFNTSDTAGNQFPGGLASDGSTMWVADEDDLKLYAYDLATKAHNPDADITLDPAQTSPGSLWYDGVAIRVYDRSDRKLYAYDAETGRRDENKDVDWPATGFAAAYGVWSDGDTVWVAEKTGKLVAYDLGAGARDQDKDLDALDGIEGIVVHGIWSDGVTMWVVDSGHDKLRALNMATGQADTDKDFQTFRHADAGSTRGIWSDGRTLWVSDWVARRVYSYNMPVSDNNDLRKVVVDGIEASGSSIEGVWYSTAASTATQTTVAATAAQLKAGASLGGADSDAVTDGHQLAIPDLTAEMTITVTAQNSDTREHTLTVSRVNTGSAQKVRVRGSVTDDVASPEEFAVVAVDLVTDELYRFGVEGVDNGNGALANPRLLGLFKLVYGTAVPVGDTEDFLGGHGANSSEVYHEPKPEGQGPATRAAYYIVVGSENGDSGGYRLSVSYEDEASADSSTTATAEVLSSSNGSGKRGRYHFRGAIGEPGDVDWIKATLEAEQMYSIVAKSSTSGNYRTLSEPIIPGLYTGDGTENYIRGTLAVPQGDRFEARLHYYAETAGVYYIPVMGYGDGVGAYDLLVAEVEDDCQPDNTSTRDNIEVDETKNARIDYRGDTDWFKAELTGGTSYTAMVAQGEGANPLLAPGVLIYDSTARMVASGQWDSQLMASVASYTPERDGVYYIVAKSTINRSGSYSVSLSE